MCWCYGYRVWLQVHLIVYVYYAYNVHNVGIMGGYKGTVRVENFEVFLISRFSWVAAEHEN